MTRRSGQYHQHLNSLNSVLKVLANKKPVITLVYGDSAKLLETGITAIKKALSNHDNSIQTTEATALKPQEFSLLLQSPPLFAQTQAHILRRLESKKDVEGFLDKIGLSSKLHASLFLLYKANKKPTKVIKKIESVGGQLIPCFRISQAELHDYIRHSSLQHKLPMTNDAIKLIIQAIGNDLDKIENEMKRLSLIFPQEKSAPNFSLTPKELTEHLELLKEEHAYAIERYILENKIGKAQALIYQLINRGSSPIAILGIITSFCRKAIKISSLKHSEVAVQNLAQMTGIHVWFVNDYRRFLSQYPKTNFFDLLCFCQQTDIKLKSTKMTMHYLLLWQILEKIRCY